MPVRQTGPARSADHHALAADLLNEWNAGQSQNAEPIIFEERGRTGKVEHVYVIWTKWAAIDRVERSEIIMDAAERHFPPAEVMNISIAMGLTPDEADRFGLQWRDSA